MRALRYVFSGWIGLAALGCGGGAGTARPPEPAVGTAPVQRRRVELALPLMGSAESARTIELRAQVEGRVVAVPVADGARVAAGTVVFELGGDRLSARRHALETGEETAARSVEAAMNRLEQAERRERSHLAAPGEISAAAEGLAAAQAQLASAKAELRRFRTSATLAAPASGRFANRRISRGQVVWPGDVLGEILEPGSIRIDAQVVPRPGLEPRIGKRAVIESVGGGEVSATVAAIQPTVTAAGTVKVWLTGDELGALAPGTAVRGRIVVAVHEDALTVPPSAVVRDSQDRSFVFVPSGGRFEERQVTTGEEGPGWIEIPTGLEPEDQVVTDGAYELYWASFGKEFKVAD